MPKNLHRYHKLIQDHPGLFESSEILPIILDEKQITEFEQKQQRDIGVVYQSKYNTLVVDLIDTGDRQFAYERIIPTSYGTPVVALVRYKDRFILIRQYRHAIRDYQLACVRGFGENTTPDGIENITKELAEELGATLEKIRYLGQVAADSGLTSSIAKVYLCDVREIAHTQAERIIEVLCYSIDEILHMIAANKINDGFTLAAFMLYLSHLVYKEEL